MTTSHKELQEALQELVEIIDKAGLLNLSKGVQLGATSWYVKANDRLEWARHVLSKAPIEGKPEGWKHEIDSFDGQGYSCLKTIVCAHPKPNWFDGHEVTKIIKSTPLYTQALATPTQGEAKVICPKCNSDQVELRHFAGDMAVPETSYYECDICYKQFGHE